MCDAPRAGSAEAKFNFPRAGGSVSGCTPCRQRRGKARGKRASLTQKLMHPVQAAPRQRAGLVPALRNQPDAPRAGSAEAKLGRLNQRGQGGMHPVQAAPRQSAVHGRAHQPVTIDAPRAGSAEAKQRDHSLTVDGVGCTPCRQRRGKVTAR